MKLELENGFSEQIADIEGLRAALATLNDSDNMYAILSESDEVYIQTSYQNGSFILEKRNGSEASHCEAVRRAGADPDLKRQFALPEVISVFTSYFNREATPYAIDWKPLKLRTHPVWVSWLVVGVIVAAIVFGLLGVVVDQINIIRRLLG